MIDIISKTMKVPAFTDEEQNIKVHLLQITLLTSLFASAVGLLPGFILGYLPLLLMLVFMLAGTLISFLLLRHGNLRFASLTILFCLLAPLVIYLSIADGIHDSLVGLFPILILIASMLLDRYDYIVYSLILFLSLQVLVLFEIIEILDNNMSQFTTYWDMVAWAVLTFILIALAKRFSETIRHSFAQVNQSNHSLQNEIKQRKQAEDALREYSEQLEDMISERTRELQEAQEKLLRQERLAALGELAGSVGHELRNPLGVISNAIYLLKMTLRGIDVKTQEIMDIITDAIDKSSKIISDLLDFARVKAINQQIITVKNLVEWAMASTTIPNNVTVHVDVPKDLPPVFVDSQQLEQVFVNLVTNGCQAMAEGGQLVITSDEYSGSRAGAPDGLPEKGRWIRVTVKDTGSGITPENLQRIFEPLFTTKTLGIGLGLAISKKLVEANEGFIEFISQLGQGTIFTVYLPVYEGKL